MEKYILNVSYVDHRFVFSCGAEVLSTEGEESGVITRLRTVFDEEDIMSCLNTKDSTLSIQKEITEDFVEAIILQYFNPEVIKVNFMANPKVNFEYTEDEVTSVSYVKMFGVVLNSPEGLYMTNENIGKPLTWVLVLRAEGWCIYVGWNKNISWVASQGDKLTGKENILKIVNCSEETLKHYVL